jgi:hypothetical protein
MGVEIKCGPLLYWYLRQLLQGGIGNVLITKTASKKKNLLRSLSLNKMFSIGVKKKMIDTQIIKDHTRELSGVYNQVMLAGEKSYKI